MAGRVTSLRTATTRRPTTSSRRTPQERAAACVPLRYAHAVPDGEIPLMDDGKTMKFESSWAERQRKGGQEKRMATSCCQRRTSTGCRPTGNSPGFSGPRCWSRKAA